MIIEVCANSYQSAINAQEAGADRIELCSELTMGGITPSYGLLKKVIENISIPIHVLIRPRSGDFTYSNEDLEIMKEDIKLCKELKCSGIVTGVLKDDHSIDIERAKELIALSKPLSFTFHRAFDWTPDPEKALKELMSLEIDRILSSGQEKTAFIGQKALKQYLKISNDRLIIMPGSGVNAENVLSFKEAGFREVHFSGTSSHKNTKPPILAMASVPLDEGDILISDKEKIKTIRNLVK